MCRCYALNRPWESFSMKILSKKNTYFQFFFYYYYYFFMSKRNFIKSAKCNQVHREYTGTTTKEKRKTIQENHYN
jgi:hypothetical protein